MFDLNLHSGYFIEVCSSTKFHKKNWLQEQKSTHKHTQTNHSYSITPFVGKNWTYIQENNTQRTQVTISNCRWRTYVSSCTINDKARGIQLSDLVRFIYRCDLISESITHRTVNQIRQLRSRRVSCDTSTAAMISSLSCPHRSYQLFLKLSAVLSHCWLLGSDYYYLLYCSLNRKKTYNALPFVSR